MEKKNTEKENTTKVMRIYNPLLDLCRDMSINENRLFYLSILAVQNTPLAGNSVILKEIIIPTSELLKLLGGNKGYYHEFAKIAARLSERLISFNKKTHKIYAYVRFEVERGGFCIMFNPKLRPLLYDVSRRPSVLPLIRTLFALNSMYAVRLLQLLLRAGKDRRLGPEDDGKFIFALEDLKNYLGVPKTSTYQQLTNLRNKVLNNQLVDINAHTPYYITYDVIKEGRRVVAFLFSLIVPKPYREKNTLINNLQTVQIVSEG